MDFEKCIFILKRAIQKLNINMYHLQGEENTRSVIDLLTQIDDEIRKTLKPRTNFDKITESVENLAEFIVEASEYQIDEYLFTYYNPALECSTSDKEEAIQHTIKWLQKECD